MTTVQRDTEKVWIEGVEGFHPGEFASSPHGCQARILQALGEALTYEDLIGYGAFAFRVGLHDGMCPSAGHPCCGCECMAGSGRALPWRVRLYEALPWAAPRPDREGFEAEACSAVRQSIDRGIPVHYSAEEDGLIIGYAEAGRRWWCLHPYHEGGRKPFWHHEATGFAGGRWPWVIAVWTEPKPSSERVPAHELLTAALARAVEMWNTASREHYFCGALAYERWIAWLRGVDAGTVADPRAGMQGNGWCFDVLAHSRRLAGPWLHGQADLLGGAAAAPLHEAADLYSHLAAGLLAGLKCPWDLALSPGRAAEWTRAMREDQVRRLEAARDHDQAAIAAIGNALESVR